VRETQARSITCLPPLTPIATACSVCVCVCVGGGGERETGRESQTNESYTYDWVMPHVRMGHVTYTNGLCHT